MALTMMVKFILIVRIENEKKIKNTSYVNLITRQSFTIIIIHIYIPIGFTLNNAVNFFLDFEYRASTIHMLKGVYFKV